MAYARALARSRAKQMTPLGRNIFSSYVARLVVAGTGFFLFPFIAARVGLTDFGIWLLINSVAMVLMGADLGMGSSVIRYVADAHARHDISRLSRVVSSTLAFYTGAGVVAALVLVLAMWILWDTLEIPAQDRDMAVVMVGIAAVAHVALGLPLTIFRQVLTGLHRLDLANALYMGQFLLRAVAIVAVLLAGRDIMAVVAVDAAALVGGGFVGLTVLRWIAPEIELRRALVGWPTLRPMLAYSLQVFVIIVAATVIVQGNSLIIGSLLPVAAVTLYAGAFNFYFVLRTLAGAAATALVPEASQASAVGDSARNRLLFLRGTKYANVLLLAAGAPLIVFAEPLLVSWGGPEFAAVSVALQLLIASLIVTANHLVALGLLTGTGRVSRFAYYHIAWALANVVLTVLLVKALGLTGAGLGTLLPLLVLEPLFVRTALREFGVTAGEFLREAVLRPAACALPAGGLLLLMALGWDLTGMVGLVLATGVFLVVLGAAFAAVGLHGDERRSLRRSLSSRGKLQPR